MTYYQKYPRNRMASESCLNDYRMTLQQEKKIIFETIDWQIRNYHTTMITHIDKLYNRLKRLERDVDSFRSSTKQKINDIEIEQHSKRFKKDVNDIIFSQSVADQQTKLQAESKSESKSESPKMSEKQKQELEKLLQQIKTIDDIIKLETIPTDELLVFKTNAKFNTLFNAIEPLKELNEMVGLEEVKKEVFKHICYFACSLHKQQEFRHILILGPSGCGKTELAKILGKLYLKLGFLKTDKFNTYTKADLVGEYVGHTAPKTQKAINDSLDGVMFVDEIYSLGNNSSHKSFDKECIDTITLNLALKNFLFIGAGYADDVEELFMKQNKGLARRITIRYYITGYNEKELYEMFDKKIRADGFKLEDGKYAQTLFDHHAKAVFKYFGGDINEFIRIIKDEYAVSCIANIDTDNTPVNTPVNTPEGIQNSVQNSVQKTITNKMLANSFEIMSEKRKFKDVCPFGMYS